MNPVRITAGINKTQHAGRMDAQIGFTDALWRTFPTSLASYLQFRDWIRQETLLDRSSVIFDVRQCAGMTNCRLSPQDGPAFGQDVCLVRQSAGPASLGLRPYRWRLTNSPDYSTASKACARSVTERPLLHAPLTILPSTAIVARQHPLGVATSLCTQPNLSESSPHVSFPCLSSLL